MPRKFFKKRRWRAKSKKGDKEKTGLSFSSKIVSMDGIICLILGIISFIMLVATIVISVKNRGQADIYVGAIGVAGFLISFSSFIISVKTLNDEYIAETIPKVAAVINFFVLLIFMGLYAYGIFMGMI
ncbi:MAG: hypothetical protein ACTTG8_05185 [Catonella sp.]|uniref:hypothetical protein n=1 Tax=Catonella sp. TaxID=2382125 RepID=UPI003FA056C4